MKRYILFFTIIVGTIQLYAETIDIQTGDKKKYIITGQVDKNLYEGQTVYLQKIDEDWKTPITVDKTEVKNGEFTFTGFVSDIPVLNLILLTVPERRIVPVIIEQGNIHMNINEISQSVSGTWLNNRFNTFDKQSGLIIKDIQELNGKLRNETDSLIKKALQIDIERKIAQWDNDLFEYIKENIKNEVGIYYFVREANNMSGKQLSNLLSLLPSVYKSSKAIERIEKRSRALDATDIGKAYIDIKGITSEGEEISLSQYAGKGKIVLVDFWASSCAPCLAKAPEFIKIYNQYKDKGFEIVGVSLDTESNAWNKAITRLSLPWPQLSDLLGWNSEIPKSYGIDLIPSTILIGKDGIIIARDIYGDQLSAKLKEIL